MTTKKMPEHDPGPLEHDGWKIGQEVWCMRASSDELACGSITRIHQGAEPCFTFVDKFDGSFRLALFSSIIPVPSADMQSKLDRTVARDIKKAARAFERRLEKSQKRSGVRR